MTTKKTTIAALCGVFIGATLATASILAAREPTPVPLRPVETPFGNNIDIPGVSGEPVFYLTMTIDGYTANFSCVKHNTIIQHAPGVQPR